MVLVLLWRLPTVKFLKMEKKLSTLIALLEKAKDGDKKSLQFLNLEEGYEYESPAPLNPETSK